jgi:hypothetical protein
MVPSIPTQTFENSEILDIHIDSSGANVVVVTQNKLRILDLAKAKVRWALQDIVIGTKCDFRAARYYNYNSDLALTNHPIFFL